MDRFAQIAEGRERWNAGRSIPRHYHDGAYVAIVLSGGYEECGSHGRFRVTAGEVLLHHAFDAHLNRFHGIGAKILNLAASMTDRKSAIGRVDDPDAIVRAAECDPSAAHAELRRQFRETTSAPDDWPDLLAHDLLNVSRCRLKHWAEQHGLAAETVSRGFTRVFGVTPAFFRREAQARRAFALIAGTGAPLASVAAATGFSDQPHMCRAVRALTGASPSAWRRSIPFKTAGTSVH